MRPPTDVGGDALYLRNKACFFPSVPNDCVSGCQTRLAIPAENEKPSEGPKFEFLVLSEHHTRHQSRFGQLLSRTHTNPKPNQNRPEGS